MRESPKPDERRDTMRMKKYIPLFLMTAMSAALVQGVPAAAEQKTMLPVMFMEASSTLPDEGAYSYEVWNLMDGDPATCWTEGAAGNGVGESVFYYVPAGDIITGAKITPGYYRDEAIFLKNGAPSCVTFSSGGQTVTQWMTPYATNYTAGFEGAYFNLTEPITSDGCVRITIQKVRDGSRYDDCCISELALYGYDYDGYNGSGEAEYENSYGMYSIDLSGTYNDSQIEDMAYLGQYLVRRHVDRLTDLTLEASDLTVDDKAFGLYWYQYMCVDDRVEVGNDFTNTVTVDNARNILKEMFGEEYEEAALSQAISMYSSDFDGYHIMFDSTGDFGDAGDWVFDMPRYDGTENGQINISGDIVQYDVQLNEYVPVGIYYVYYDEEAAGYTGDYETYTFDEVDIEIYNGEQAPTYDELNQSGAEDEYQTGDWFTSDELCKIALDYYENMYGYRPSMSAYEEQEDGTVVLQLYDLVRDHTSTSAWYQVDHYGRGENFITGEAVDFINY